MSMSLHRRSRTPVGAATLVVAVAAACADPQLEVTSSARASLALEARLVRVGQPRTSTTLVAHEAGRTRTLGEHELRDEMQALLPAAPSTPKPTPAAEGELPVADDQRARLLELISSYPSDRLVPVVMAIEEPPFDWHAFAGNELSESERLAAVAIRSAQIDRHTLELRERLQAVGAKNVETFLVVAAVAASVPAGRVREVNGWPDVLNLVGDAQLASREEAAYGGLETKTGMKIDAFAAAGVDASSGARSGTSGRVRVGVVDGLDVNATHDGFDDCVSPPPFCFPFQRFVAKYDCSTGACAPWTPTYTPATINHGTYVSKIIDGYIAGGTADTERKSGVIPGGRAALYYYGAQSANAPSSVPGLLRALSTAWTDHIDVLNVSQGYSGFDNDFDGTYDGCCQPCDPTCDCGGLNAALKNAVDSGILIVKSAGNEGQKLSVGAPNSCRLTYPANRRDVLVAGGMATASTASAYDGTGVWNPNAGVLTGSSRGGVGITTASVYRGREVAGIDLIAPAQVSYHYVDTAAFDLIDKPGTSAAAAAISGGAALLRSGAAGVSSTYAWTGRSLLTNLLLSGDGYKYDGGNATIGFDQRSGGGRVHLHYPSPSNIGSVSGWGSVANSVAQGQVQGWYVADGSLTGAGAAQVTQLKVAMTFDEPNFSNAADLDLRIYWACPGSSYGTILKQQYDYDVRNRLELTPGEVAAAFSDVRCWGISVYGYTVPAGARGYNLAWYYHAQNPTLH